jgi:hypothetical protein
MIAESGDVDAQQVRDLIYWRAVEERRNRSSLDQIAGIEVQASRAVRFLLPDGRRQTGKPASLAIVGNQVRMQIIRMKNGERARGVLRA